MSTEKSYGQILKASSIMGGSAAITLLVSMLKIKCAAILIGSTGVGLNASFTAIQNLIGSIAGVGLQFGAVRNIAAAESTCDQQAIGRMVCALRRLCWLTGLIGMVSMMLLGPLLSQITFGHRDYALDISSLGLTILFANISGGHIALIQGKCRIGAFAKANIFSAVFGSFAAVGFYATLGLRGIVPALITAAAVQMCIAWVFARQFSVHRVDMTFRETFTEAQSMVRLGLVMMFNGLMLSAVNYVTVTLITQREGVQQVGIYGAAFALSGVFVNFVLGAMAADYYPRLTGAATDRAKMNRLVNEQTEIAILLALPGLLVTLTMAHSAVQLLYSSQFFGAVKLLQWFTLGCMGRIISWPLSFVMLALGKGRWFLLTETSFNLIYVVLIVVGLKFIGIEGIAVAFFVMNLGYTAAVYLVCRHLIDFAWSSGGKRIAIIAIATLGATFVDCRYLPLWPASIIGLGLSVVISIFCLRGLVTRIGSEHRVAKAIARLLAACRP